MRPRFELCVFLGTPGIDANLQKRENVSARAGLGVGSNKTYEGTFISCLVDVVGRREDLAERTSALIDNRGRVTIVTYGCAQSIMLDGIPV